MRSSLRVRNAECGVRNRTSKTMVPYLVSLIVLVLFFAAQGRAGESEDVLELRSLVDEALKNNRELLAAESRWKASTYRIPQAKTGPTTNTRPTR